MFPVPSPLHAAIVHFPIVLILVGTAVAVAAAFTRRWNLPTIALVVLALAAAGTGAAVATGDEEGESVGGTPAIEKLIEEHEEWAERTLTVTVIAAVLALASAVTGKWPALGRSTGIATAVVALAASLCVSQTGHRGGLLVYRHGAGVLLAGPADAAGGPQAAQATSKRPEGRDDD